MLSNECKIGAEDSAYADFSRVNRHVYNDILALYIDLKLELQIARNIGDTGDLRTDAVSGNESAGHIAFRSVHLALAARHV